MPEESDDLPQPPVPEQPTLLGNLPPDEMFARGMQSVKMTSSTAGTWQPPTLEEIATLFPNYEILGLLGRGGMGAVYKARQTMLDRLVAIKLLPLEISVDKDFADRFVREARAMARLHHPNIITVFEFGKSPEGHLFFVMEYVEGANLYDVVHQVGLNGDQALSIVEQVCTALAYAHAKGIVHRDIKPANVMIDTESHVKVADFGLARLTDNSAADLGHTMTGTVMGTPDYMAPEQMKGMNVDHRADIYSVGVMIYEMLCREVPKGIFDPPSHRTGCDARIDQIVIRALQQSPDRRYQSTQEMKVDILAARQPVVVPEGVRVSPRAGSAPLAGGDTGPTPPKPAPPGPPKKPGVPLPPGQRQPPAGNQNPTEVASQLPSPPQPALMKAIPLPAPKAKSKTLLYAGGAATAVAIAAAILVPKLGGTRSSVSPISPNAAENGSGDGRAGARPSDATKDAPFVNTLGMKFVPVPGADILLCVHETRRKDYAAFSAAVPGVDATWKAPLVDGKPLEQQDDHPVVMVSWDDASAFCSWLGKKEGRTYRLPTEHEWNLAVVTGLDDPKSISPAELAKKLEGQYPWETANLSDADKLANYQGIQDGYAGTAPVMSFPPNHLGIYDLGGNAWEWCADWMKADHQQRVLRGGGYLNFGWPRKSSWRVGAEPNFRTPPNGDFDRRVAGFRCVLVPTAPGGDGRAGARPSAALEPGARRLFDTPKKIPKGPAFSWDDNALHISGGSAYGEFPHRDAILRATVRMNTDCKGAQLCLRNTPTGAGVGGYALTVHPDVRKAVLQLQQAGKVIELKAWPFPREYATTEWAVLQLKVQGDEISATMDGIVLGTARDSAVTGPGKVMVYSPGNAFFRDIVYVPLDAPASNTATTEHWQDVLHDPTKLVLLGQVERTPEGLRFTDAGSATLNPSLKPQRDGAVRMRSTFGSARPQLVARRIDDGSLIGLNAKDQEKMFVLTRWDNVARQIAVLREFSPREPLQTGQDYELELRVVGQNFTAILNGETLGTVTDGTFPEGRFGVGVGRHNREPVLIKSLEVLDLDAPGGQAATEPWQNLLAAPDTLALYNVERIAPDSLVLPRGGSVWPKTGAADGAIRMKAIYDPQRHAPQLFARAMSSTKKYALNFADHSQEVFLARSDESGAFVNLARYPVPQPLAAGSEYELELRAIGDLLVTKINGQVLGEIRDAAYPAGNFGVSTMDPAVTEIKALHFLRLDPPGKVLPASHPPEPMSSPAPSAATKDAPFVNTLGMQFVPVPITGGPTGGQRVLFSVWDTRVQDYEAFVKETKREWPKAPFAQDVTHPAVNVSWDDARAFCQWLTERERQAGKLGAGEAYRLPTDHEWSCAVGIGDREDAAKLPSKKSLAIADTFPWGTQWPPPASAGNYAGEEVQPLLGGDQFPLLKNAISGHRDDYLQTSPVGSFAANRFGLYDMGGNVWQWCEDRFDPTQDHRVARGGSWPSADRGSLLSSVRLPSIPNTRSVNFGFRCVLAPAAVPLDKSPQPVPSSSPATPSGWRPLLSEADWQKTDAGRTFENGRLHLVRGNIHRYQPSPDGALRTRVEIREGTSIPGITTRLTNGVGAYHMGLNEERSEVALRFDSASEPPLRLGTHRLPQPLRPGDTLDLELQLQDDHLIGKVNGLVVFDVRDSHDKVSGRWGCDATDGWFVSAEFQPLAAAPAAPSPVAPVDNLLSKATRDAPFVNTLGMKFVPVPGTKVLFSIWDTRVQDYTVYATGRQLDISWTNRNWGGVPAGHEPTHPVVGVSWTDAQGFCQWLTAREAAEGKLPAGWEYRLPTDEEWSRAVGLPPEEGATPAEKSLKNSVDFPWGQTFPPTRNAGNYADETFHLRLIKPDATNPQLTVPWIKGYTDGYITTSPVGSFPANAQGLYDMSGNVWQWCEDWYDDAHREHVLRGSTWTTSDRQMLLSSHRGHNVAGYHTDFGGGFRCVLAPAPAPPESPKP